MGLIGQDCENGRKGKRKKERKKRILFFSPRKVAFLSPGKRKKSPRTPVFPRDKGKEEREKKKKGMALG